MTEAGNLDYGLGCLRDKNGKKENGFLLFLQKNMTPGGIKEVYTVFCHFLHFFVVLVFSSGISHIPVLNR